MQRSACHLYGAFVRDSARGHISQITAMGTEDILTLKTPTGPALLVLAGLANVRPLLCTLYPLRLKCLAGYWAAQQRSQWRAEDAVLQ